MAGESGTNACFASIEIKRRVEEANKALSYCRTNDSVSFQLIVRDGAINNIKKYIEENVDRETLKEVLVDWLGGSDVPKSSDLGNESVKASKYYLLFMAVEKMEGWSSYVSSIFYYGGPGGTLLDQAHMEQQKKTYIPAYDQPQGTEEKAWQAWQERLVARDRAGYASSFQEK